MRAGGCFGTCTARHLTEFALCAEGPVSSAVLSLAELAGGHKRDLNPGLSLCLLAQRPRQGLRLPPLLLFRAVRDFGEGITLGKFLNFSEFWSTYL